MAGVRVDAGQMRAAVLRLGNLACGLLAEPCSNDAGRAYKVPKLCLAWQADDR
jgi:hypothetical protein